MLKMSYLKKSTKPIWERLEEDGETFKAYLAFCSFRDMGKSRTLFESYKILRGGSGGDQGALKMPKKVPTNWSEWSRANGWVRRAKAYDEYLLNATRRITEETRLKNIEEFQKLQEQISSAQLALGIKMLTIAYKRMTILLENENEIALLPLYLLPAFLRAANEVLKTALEVKGSSLGIYEILRQIEGVKEGRAS